MGEKIELPDTLSGLLRLAVKDARAIEKTAGYRLNMSKWVWPASDGVCEVCMAGAIMVRTMGGPARM